MEAAEAVIRAGLLRLGGSMLDQLLAAARCGSGRCSTTASTVSAPTPLLWLALLLIRVAENAAGGTWRNLRHELDRMHLVTLATAEGRVAQRSATMAGQQAILGALEPREPPKFFDFTPASG
jgi:hypothetical protein